MLNKYRKGFTLIELLIVIGIIAILAGIVLVAVNPAEQFGKANDSERKSEIGMLLSAVYQAQTAPSARGKLPTCHYDDTAITGATNTEDYHAFPPCSGTIADQTLSTAETNLFAGAFEVGTVTGGTDGDDTIMDCSAKLIPSYLRDIPVDPGQTAAEETANQSGYFMCTTSEGAGQVTVHVLAPKVEVFNTDEDDVVSFFCGTTNPHNFACTRTDEVTASPLNAMAVEG